MLKVPVFTHGQLYVALSRATSQKGVKVYVEGRQVDEKNGPTTAVRNVVYQDLFVSH